MEKQPIGLAVLGAGAVVTARHLPALAAAGGRAVSIFDPCGEAARKAAADFDIALTASSMEEAVRADGVEAVLIASPNAFHRGQAECAFDAGRHVLCEKPIALKPADAQAMVRAAERSGRTLQVGFHHRFSAEHNCAKTLLEAGLLGGVQAFNGVIGEPFEVIPGGLANYRFNAAQGGGFTLIDVGQHRIDETLALLGGVAEVYVEMASVMGTHGLDDSAVLLLKMESGAVGSLSWHRFSRAFVSPSIWFGSKAVLCAGAFITAPFQSAPLSIFLEDDPEQALPAEILSWTRPRRWWGDLEPGWVDIWPPRRNTFEEQWRNFFGAARGENPPAADGMDGCRALEIVQAAYLSFAERRPVKLPLPPDAYLPPPTWGKA